MWVSKSGWELVGAGGPPLLESFGSVEWTCFHWKGAFGYKVGPYLQWNQSIVLKLSERSHVGIHVPMQKHKHTHLTVNSYNVVGLMINYMKSSELMQQKQRYYFFLFHVFFLFSVTKMQNRSQFGWRFGCIMPAPTIPDPYLDSMASGASTKW